MKKIICIIAGIVLSVVFIIFAVVWNKGTEPSKPNVTPTPSATSTPTVTLAPTATPFPESQGLEYIVNNDGETCTMVATGKCTDAIVNIPEKIDGYRVTAIGNFAFWDCSNVTNIIIPSSVTSISPFAFGGSEIKSITIPESVFFIDRAVFANCKNLETIIVDKENKKYDSRENCNAVIETDTNTLIAGGAKSVIPSGVTSIGEEVFWGCEGLTGLTIPDTVTSIGEGAFGYCENMLEITIPDSVKHIDEGAFMACSSLQSIVIPNGVSHIEKRTFWGCHSLSEITIPDSVTHIGLGAFEGCHSLSEITIPDGVDYIGFHAFLGCINLSSIYVNAGTYAEKWLNDNGYSAKIKYIE